MKAKRAALEALKKLKTETVMLSDSAAQAFSMSSPVFVSMEAMSYW